MCGSDLWDWRGINPVTEAHPIGHEYCGIVEGTGSEVTTIKPGQLVIGSFFALRQQLPELPGRVPVLLPAP